MTPAGPSVQPTAPENSIGRPLHGVIAVPTTPCRAPGEIDPPAMMRLCQILSAKGCHGIFAVGSTGEMPLLDEDDRRALSVAAREGTGPQTTLYIGITGNGLKQSIRYAHYAAHDGADVGVAMVPDMFRFGQPEIIQYMRAIADASPIPVAIYHHMRMPTELAVDTVAELADHPNIVALKDTSGDFDRCRALIAATSGKSIAILQGSEKLIHDSILAGGAGCVAALAAVAPEWHVQLYQALRNGQEAEAIEWQRRIMDIFQLFLYPEIKSSFCYFPYALKIALRYRGWLEHVDALMVGWQPDEAFERKVTDHLRAIGLETA